MAKKPLVLIVDDEPHMRHLLQFILSRLPCRLETASNGTAAIAIASSRPIDLLVIDVMMSGKDGIETTAELRRMPRYATLPVVMLTGLGTDRVRQAAACLNVEVFLTKPFSPSEFTRHIAALLRRHRGTPH